MALQSSIGITVGVSATLPASHNAAGFEALTFTSCGKLEGSPPMTGNWDIATFTSLSTGEEEKLLDKQTAGSGEMSFGYDGDDTGQGLLETASDATTTTAKTVALAFTLANGDIYYRLALITSYAPEGSIGNVLMAKVGCEFTKSHVKTTA